MFKIMSLRLRINKPHTRADGACVIYAACRTANGRGNVSTRGADECQYSHRRAAGDEGSRNPTLYLAAFAIVTVLEVVPGACPISETYTQSSGGAILAKW